MKRKSKQNAGNFGQPDRVLPQYQYGGNMKQNAGGGDAYDFGSSVLQNYTQMQSERQNTEQQQQYAQEPQEESAPEGTPAETEVQGDPDELGIPDAGYFARKSYEYNGDREMQDKIDEISAQMAELQNNYNVLLAGQTDDFSTDDEDGEGGDGYYNGAGSGNTSSAGTIPVASTSDTSSSIPAGSNMPKGSRGSAAIRHNNPGNIKFGDFAKGFDAEQGDMSPEGNPFAYFPTIEKGLQAQRALLKGKTYRNLTVEQAMNRWITGNPNQPGIYAKRAAAMFNNRKISELSDSELQQLQNFMIKNEDKDMAEKLHLVQSGGKVPVAQSYADKYHGLNNDTLNELLIKNNGYNEYRGLDSGRPVHLYDDLGASAILFGPDDLATLYGNVYEHR
jgi:hypothetical protein